MKAPHFAALATQLAAAEPPGRLVLGARVEVYQPEAPVEVVYEDNQGRFVERERRSHRVEVRRAHPQWA